MIISKLKNPKTKEYQLFKKKILDKDFSWFYKKESNPEFIDNDVYTSIPFFSHVIVERPEDSKFGFFPSIKSNILDDFFVMLKQIEQFNNFKINCILRANLNLTKPSQFEMITHPHYDHHFSHKNILMYFTDSGGETIFFDGDTQYEYSPCEDDIIYFPNLLHCSRTSKKSDRVISVVTFI